MLEIIGLCQLEELDLRGNDFEKLTKDQQASLALAIERSPIPVIHHDLASLQSRQERCKNPSVVSSSLYKPEGDTSSPAVAHSSVASPTG